MPILTRTSRPKHSVHVRMDLEVYKTVRDYAKQRNLSVSWVINDVLSRAARAMNTAKA